jgi:NAD+ kinase
VKFDIVAKNPDRGEDIKAKTLARGFTYDPENPDFIITVGGDGTFLIAERDRAGIPKLLVRDSLVCFKCNNEPFGEMLDAMETGDSFIKEFIKIQATYPNGQLIGVNDVVLRNQNPTVAIRLEMTVDGEVVEEMLIGDGVVVATPFGATGYYQSVTRSTFEKGIGVGFNNPTRPKDPLILSEDSQLTLKIIRAPGQLAVDNNPNIITLGEGDLITVKKAPEVARLIFNSREENNS